MGQTILVKMKKTGDLLSSHKVYISRDRLFQLLKFFENMSDEEDRTYGSVIINYSENDSGCKIHSDLSMGQFKSLAALLGVFKDDG